MWCNNVCRWPHGLAPPCTSLLLIIHLTPPHIDRFPTPRHLPPPYIGRLLSTHTPRCQTPTGPLQQTQSAAVHWLPPLYTYPLLPNTNRPPATKHTQLSYTGWLLSTHTPRCWTPTGPLQQNTLCRRTLAAFSQHIPGAAKHRQAPRAGYTDHPLQFARAKSYW
jgi:hypothetical protein